MSNLITDMVKVILFDLDDINDVINFCSTNKFYYSVLKEENFWTRRYRHDFGEEMKEDKITSTLELTPRLIYVQRYTQEGGITYGSQYFRTLDVLIPRAIKTCPDNIVMFFIGLYNITYSNVKDNDKDNDNTHLYFFLANSYKIIVDLLKRYGYDIAYNFYQGAKFFHEKHLYRIKSLLFGYLGEYPKSLGLDCKKYFIEGALIGKKDDLIYSLISKHELHDIKHNSTLDIISIALKNDRRDFVDKLINKGYVDKLINKVNPFEQRDDPINKLLALNRKEKIDLDEYQSIFSKVVIFPSFNSLRIIPPRYDIVEFYRKYGFSDHDIACNLNTSIGFRDIETIKLAEKYIACLKSDTWRLEYLKNLLRSNNCTYQKILVWLIYSFDVSPLPGFKFISSYIRVLYRSGYKSLWFYLNKRYRKSKKVSRRGNKLDKTPCEMDLLSNNYNTIKGNISFLNLGKSIYHV